MQIQDTGLLLTDEKEIIRRTLAGDTDAFSHLVLRYKDSLFDLACRMLGNRTEAEDAVQDGFVDAYRHLAGFHQRSRFSTWIYSIVLNRVRNLLRHRKALRWSSLDYVPKDLENHRLQEIPERGRSLHQRVEDKMELETIQEAVSRLPMVYQSIFILHYFQNISLEDVADRLGRPLGTVKVYLHRSRKMLYDQLQHILTGEAPVRAVRRTCLRMI